MEILIIHEDENMLVINKPSGLAAHASLHSTEPTLVDWLLKNYPAIKNVGEDLTRPGLVHRLDKETSGVMIIAKNQETFWRLKQQFHDRKVVKHYRLIVRGVIKAAAGEIKIIALPIGRSRNDPRRRIAGRGASGKLREALTEYRLLENFADYTYLEAAPKTGRTHQIRVHFNAIGHPVAGDKLYDPRHSPLAPLPRLALHAESLELETTPNKRMRFEAELPSDFQTALESLRRT